MRIAHLDGLRGLAIIWVIAYHAYSRWFDYTHLLSITKDIAVFKFGYLGVPLFFMISGFVIFMTLDKSKNFTEYMKRRWLRLFPAMLIASIIIYITAAFFYERPLGQPTPLDTIPGLTFISDDLIKFITGYNIKPLEGVFWSLYVEVFFYILIGLVYFFIGRKYCIPALLAIFSTFYISFLLKYFGYTKPFELVNILGFPHYVWFIIGCVVYEAINNRGSKLNLTIAVLAVIMLLGRIFYNSNGDLLLIVFNLATIVLFVISFYSSRLQNILSVKLLLITGFVSYPLYLIHEGILVSSLIKLHKLGVNDLGMYLMPIIITIILTAIAYIIAKYLEPQLRKKIEKLISPKFIGRSPKITEK